jgi:hypothetical protein
MDAPQYEWFNRLEETLYHEILTKLDDDVWAYFEDCCVVIPNLAGKHRSLRILDESTDHVLTELFFDPLNQYFYVKKSMLEEEIHVVLRELEDILRFIEMTVSAFSFEQGELDFDEDEFEEFEQHHHNIHPFLEMLLKEKEEYQQSESIPMDDINWLTDEIITEEFKRDLDENEIRQISGKNTHFRLGEYQGELLILRGETLTIGNGDMAATEGTLLKIKPSEVDILIETLQNYKKFLE